MYFLCDQFFQSFPHLFPFQGRDLETEVEKEGRKTSRGSHQFPQLKILYSVNYRFYSVNYIIRYNDFVYSANLCSFHYSERVY